MTKCGKCGKPGHNARSCGRKPVTKNRPRAERKGGSSWLKNAAKTLGGKLESVGEDAGEPTAPKESAELPTPTEGNPFEGLPSLDLPSTESGSDSATEPSPSDATTESTQSTSSGSSEEKSAPKGAVKIDVAEIEGMIGPFVEQGVRAAGAYAIEHGFFALGDPFPRLARECACVIIRKRATEIGMDEEEYAAWLLGGIVGVNGVQAFRAYKQESAKEKQAKATKDATDNAKRRSDAPPIPGDPIFNGTPPKQSKPDEQHRFQLAGPLV